MTTDAAADPIIEQAAQWIVLLTSDSAAERERARLGFEDWKQADPRHAAAATEMEHFLGRVQVVRQQTAGSSRPARAALDAVFGRARNRRRTKRTGTTLAVLLTLVATTWLTLRAWPPAYLTADLRTARGQWETRTLSDGTHLTVGSEGAVNLRYDERQRTLELIQGAILVEVAHDTARPFIVTTTEGNIRALGTRFTVERRKAVTILSMMESRVAVQTAVQRDTRSNEVKEVGAGQRVRITAKDVSSAESIDARALADAWQYRQLVISDRPLAAVLDELGRHRPGRILYDSAELEGIRVSAVLPLDDTDRALQLLQDNFPTLRVRRLTPYLLWVNQPAD